MSNLITCPSGMQLRIRGMKVAEERVLADKKLAKSGEMAERIAQSCVEELIAPGPYKFTSSVKWSDVLSGDLMFVILRIREATYGLSYAFSATCPNGACEESFEWEVNTTELPVRSIAVSDVTEKIRVTLPESGAVVTFHRRLNSDNAKARKLRKEHEDQPLSSLLLSCIDTIDGVADDMNARRAFINELAMPEILELSDLMDDHECGVETKIMVACPHCGREFEIDIPFGPQFFLKRRKKK